MRELNKTLDSVNFSLSRVKFLVLYLTILIGSQVLTIFAAIEADEVDTLFTDFNTYFVILAFLFVLLAYIVITRIIWNTIGVSDTRQTNGKSELKMKGLFVDSEAFISYQQELHRKLRTRFKIYFLLIMIIWSGPTYLQMILLSDTFKTVPTWDFYSFQGPINTILALSGPISWDFFFAFILYTIILSLKFLISISNVVKTPKVLALSEWYSPREDLEKRRSTLSLSRLRQEATIIPSITLKFSLLGVVSLLIFNTAVFIMINSPVFTELRNAPGAEGEWVRISQFFLLITILVINIVSIITILFIFLYPQWSLRNFIKNEKIKRIKMLDERYEQKRSELLSQVFSNQSMNTQVDDLQVMHFLIQELREIHNWPFNYQQAVTLGGSLAFPVISYLVSFVSYIF